MIQNPDQLLTRYCQNAQYVSPFRIATFCKFVKRRIAPQNLIDNTLQLIAPLESVKIFSILVLLLSISQFRLKT